MANPFSKMQEYFTAPHRNTHDTSFVNNLTMDFGKLVPVFYRDVVPGESFRITPTFRMNFQPMVFPVQTNMRAHLHFFYCRNKDVYKDWLDLFGMTKEGLEMPYMKLTEENRDMVNTGELGDYLGIPTVTYGSFGGVSQVSISSNYYDFAGGYQDGYYMYLDSIPERGNPFSQYVGRFSADSAVLSQGFARGIIVVDLQQDGFDINQPFEFSLRTFHSTSVDTTIYAYAISSDGTLLQSLATFDAVIPSNQTGTHYSIFSSNLGFFNDEILQSTRYIAFSLNLRSRLTTQDRADELDDYDMVFTYRTSSSYGMENSELQLSELPFISDENPEGERLVNLPFRFYEFIYNSFYRDERNNPYKIDGQVEYNKYLPSTEGGEDTYHYQLRHANWEQDFLTTATASPQFGVAPLVGVTATGTMTFQDEEGNTYTAVAKTGDDNDTITGIEVHSPDMPVGTMRALIDTVSSGISISDFRNVNALQRLLEKRLRHGLKYVDMVQASYGTRPKNLEISMPEFIGGVNEDVIVNRISQTVDTEAVPLGTVGGQASVLGTSNHPISCYCDDFGCIMGIMYIAPVPNYSQLLPKYWLKSEALDFYHPEFSHIGYQPILNKEVAPLQFFRDDKANGTDNYNSVFGYQRPWYDYISSVDEVHGNFRNNMRRYLINRVFDTPPTLTEDFLLVDSKQVNDVFAVTENSDKIFGEILFRVKRKNAVPTLSIPRLES